MKTVIIDYGIGNLRSVQKALESLGADVVVSSQAKVILAADKAILPGVGAFKDGMAGLAERQLESVVQTFAEEQRPFLGICLGMQLLFETSFEMGEAKGLSILPGSVKKFPATDLTIPQTGWNQLMFNPEQSLFHNLRSGAYVYFNHSYYCAPKDESAIIARTSYGIDYAAAVQKNMVFGVQFHPEKSQRVGLQILKNFMEL
jgi:glutamine amidotransferase